MLQSSIRILPRALRRGLPAIITLLAAAALSGCSASDLPVINTIGPIAANERDLLYIALALMMIVAIPVWIMAVWFPWKYRASNTQAEYRPHWDFSLGIELAVWLVPALIVVVIGVIVWNDTHSLDPYKPLPGEAPLKIEAVALDWKWVFIYPEQDIATVNFLALPTKRPVTIELTSDTVMNSLYLPGIAGQIYAMAGMKTELNLQTDKPDKTTGLNTMFSGGDFPDQHFEVDSLTKADFDKWVSFVQQTPKPLTLSDYGALSAARATAPVTLYSGVASDLFKKIIAKYKGKDGTGMGDMAMSATPATQDNQGH